MSVASVHSRATVQTAIAAASRKTGVDFNYLVGQAQVESGMRADARAATSSATGLYQFIDQSWLGVIKQHGAAHGLRWAADSITQNANGRYSVSDPDTRQAILNMRRDPNTAAIMAAEHASDNKAMLEGQITRPTNGTDLYMAHFLGPKGAAKFLRTMEQSPNRTGADLFPAAARANRNVFYSPAGQPRTLNDIYTRFAGKLDRGAEAGGAAPVASGKMPDLLAALSMDDVGEGDVILGNEPSGDDRHWVETTLAQLGMRSRGAQASQSGFARTTDPMRPTPETAKLAYLMLAKLGA